jgi:hypothetical protein
MTQFEKDLEQPLSINGAASSKGFYNLIVSIRDVKLWSKGIKPHRFWKVTDVKKYFGIKGNKEALVSQLEELKLKYFPS